MKQDIYELLTQIKERPSRWLRTPQISFLEAFVDGFNSAQSSEVAHPSAWPPLSLLTDWFADKLQQGGSPGWARMLTHHCQGDEQAALHLFFDLLEEFKALHVVRVVELELDDAAYAFYASEACQAQPYYVTSAGRIPIPAPEALCVIKFSGGLGYYVFHRQPGQRLMKQGWYASFRACLHHLRQQFGATVKWQEAGKLSAAAITDLL
jgi:hypothetical protein